MVVGAIVVLGYALWYVRLIASGFVTGAVILGQVVAAVLLTPVLLGVQQLEGNVLYPTIMRRRIELHPFATLLVVGAGGVLAGIGGALVAVPLAAVVATVLPIVRGHSPPPALDPADG